MLGGAIAGLNVTQTSGQPGGGSTIRIRGGNSLHAGNEPLYVIDGFLFYSDKKSTSSGFSKIESSINPLALINPNDIESIEILKDVSATAIYGSRGANGVIIVSTKKGKIGQNQINYQYSIGQQKISKKLDLMNVQEWALLQNDFGYHHFDENTISRLGEGADWQNAVFRTGIVQNHELSIRGGENKTRYLLSGGYVKQDGILLNSGFERYNVRINLDREIFSNLTTGVTTTASKSVQNSLTTVEENDPTFKGRIINSLGYALRIPPVVPIYDADGNYNYTNPYEKSDLKLDGKSPNPVSDMNNSVGENENVSLLGNFFIKYEFIKGLTAKINAGSHISHTNQKIFAPATSAVGLPYRGYEGFWNERYETWLSEYTLNYNKIFNPVHQVDVLAGYTTEKSGLRYVLTESSRFSSAEKALVDIYDGNGVYPPHSKTINSWIRSVLGRVNYSLLGRYHLTATFRADESSRLAPGNRWGHFPSAGLSWNINEERFLKDLTNLNLLKLRLSAGTVGNQEIEDNLYAPNYEAVKYSAEGELITTYQKKRLGNPNLKWEITAQYNTGIDAKFWHNRLNFTVDVYYKKTFDLLFDAPADPTTGFQSQRTVSKSKFFLRKFIIISQFIFNDSKNLS
jgi:TonB-linked SusC/RagA family outer membrane protein